MVTSHVLRSLRCGRTRFLIRASTRIRARRGGVLPVGCSMIYMDAFRARLVDGFIFLALWGSVLATASGAGMLLEAIVDTIRYGHPR